MASTDATPFMKKGVAFRWTFPIFDATGSLVTGATSLDSEISKDGGTYADCTNEATEIATASGTYYLDLTSTETNADTVAVIVKSGNGKTAVLIERPVEAGDITVDVTHFGGTAGTFSGGRPEVNTTHAAGTAWGSGAITAASIASDAITAAKIADNAIDAGAIASDAITAAKIATGALTAAKFAADAITSTVIADNAITAGKIAADAIGASELAADAVTEIQNGLATSSALSSVASAITTIDGIVDDILVDTAAIPSAASIATAVMGSTIEGSYDVTEMHRLFAAVLLGKASGLATTTATFRDTGDSKDRVVATVDASGNRSAVTLDAS